MRQYSLLLSAVFLLAGTFCLCEEVIITTDGRSISGSITTVGAALKVETVSPRRDVYLSPTLVAERKIAESVKEVDPSFVFNSSSASEKKKGAIGPVVNDFKWGEWQPDGSTTISLRDPVLGAVEFRAVISRVTPRQVEVRGVDYEWIRTFPAQAMESLIPRMVEDQVRQNPTSENWLKLAAFSRMQGNQIIMERSLERAQSAGAHLDACALERTKFEIEKFIRHLAELEKRSHSNRAEDAFREAVLLEVPNGLQSANPILFKTTSFRLADLKKRANQHRENKEALSKRNLSIDSLSPIQMDRLVRVLKQGPAQVDEKWIPELCKEWAEGLALVKWDGPIFQEAIRIAPLIETYFEQGDIKQSAALAASLKTSQLPLDVKLSLFRHASRFPDVPANARNGWKRIEFKHPEAAQAFHYFVQVPASYQPNISTPVLVAMHGQTSTAEIMHHFWSEYAAREGWILISPEYIYGRSSGYLFSSEEHQAVVEAVRHAGRTLNIDPDRVFLTGHSQGGHAAWDIGPSHAGVFAAVVPIIGAPVMPDHWSNFRDTSLYVIDGSLDGAAPQMNRRAIEGLARLRAEATYVEYIDRGHESFSEEYGAVCDWLRTRRRERCKTVNMVAFRNVERRRRWVEILATQGPLLERLAGVLKVATIEGQLKPNNQFELKTGNVTRLRILIPAGQVDLSKPISVILNGRAAWRGVVQLDWNLALRESLTRCDRSDIFLAEVLLDVR